MCGIVSQASSSSSNNLSCMIDADHTATSHVSGSRRFGLVIDEVITPHQSVTGSHGVHRGTARVCGVRRGGGPRADFVSRRGGRRPLGPSQYCNMVRLHS